MPTSGKGLSGAALKYLAMLSMLLDHAATAFWMIPWLPHEILHHIGRLAFPLFCFFLVEGAVHSSDMRRFLGRLAIFAILSELPFDMAMRGVYLYNEGCNVLWTLLLGLLAIYLWQQMVEGEPAFLASRGLSVTARSFLTLPCIFVLIALAYFVHTDYGAAGVTMIFVMYVFRQRLLERDICTAALLLSFGMYELWALPAIALFHVYNGKRGHQPRWLFYAFYPAHLFLLGALRIWYF